MRFLVITILYFSSLAVNAQNLVSNPGFEEYFKCPGSYNQGAEEFRLKDWSSASTGTPDHFHSCSNGEAGVPHNWAGVSEAYEGRGYVGLYMWMNNERNYREYLQTKLLEPLVKDSAYILQFSYKLSSYSMYAIDRIGLLIQSTPVLERHDKVLNQKPTFAVVQDSALTQKTGLWESAKFEYKAKGGEQYLIIGNFDNDNATKFYHLQFSPEQQEMLKRSSYYYIDDVQVLPKFLPEIPVLADVIPEFNHSNTELNKSYILKNINFEFDSYRLQNSSFEELDMLVGFLHANPQVTVQLSGHTDDVGGERYNLTLSRNRSKTVASYLVAQGIKSERIETYGYGKARPLAEGDSEQVRKLNRRVEVKFIQ